MACPCYSSHLTHVPFLGVVFSNRFYLKGTTFKRNFLLFNIAYFYSFISNKLNFNFSNKCPKLKKKFLTENKCISSTYPLFYINLYILFSIVHICLFSFIDVYLFFVSSFLFFFLLHFFLIFLCIFCFLFSLFIFLIIIYIFLLFYLLRLYFCCVSSSLVLISYFLYLYFYFITICIFIFYIYIYLFHLNFLSVIFFILYIRFIVCSVLPIIATFIYKSSY